MYDEMYNYNPDKDSIEALLQILKSENDISHMNTDKKLNDILHLLKTLISDNLEDI